MKLWKIKREILHIYHRIKYGISEKDTWNLTNTIDGFIYEGLKRFIKVNNGHPAYYTEKDWDNILKEMLEGYELIVQHKEIPYKGMPLTDYFYTNKEMNKINRARKLYNSHNLWW